MKKWQHAAEAGVVIAWLSLLAFCLYYGLAWAAFQWRNPKANQMSYYRDFGAVVKWQRLEKYQ